MVKYFTFGLRWGPPSTNQKPDLPSLCDVKEALYGLLTWLLSQTRTRHGVPRLEAYR